MTDLFDLTGRIAIITGGGGILGQEFCRVLADHGAAVVIADIDEDAALTTADAVRNTSPDARLLCQHCDVSDPASVADMVAATVSAFGRIDILHNNAAAKTADLKAFFAPFEDYTLETWREIMAVNIDGMFLVAQAAGRQMIAQQTGGSVIQTASVYGVLAPDPRIYEGSSYLGGAINTPAAYSASKAAVVGLSRHLATHWAPHGIRVNTLTPGGIESGQNETFVKRYSDRVPLGRMGRASEMQAALLYLASDASSYMTGQNLIVDGGLNCW